MTSVSDPLSRTSRQENVKKYYGDVLNTSDDLATDACATIEETPPHLARAFKNIHPEVSARYYGCGLVAPSGLLGAKVLDLGCGAGRDVYALAQLVGPSGHVTGVDMTPEQLEVARRHQDWHKQRFGFNETNVTFMDGDIERLDALELGEGVFDVIVSNCVINLCSDKNAVFSNAFRLLKPGGEMYFADVYADRRLPPEARNDDRAHGECLAGALFWEDFIGAAQEAGFRDPRLVTHRALAINDEALKDLLAPATFQSATYRLIKSASSPSEPARAKQVTYLGSHKESAEEFRLDKDNIFKAHQPTLVSSDTAHLIKYARWSDAFTIMEADGCGAPPSRSPFDGRDEGTPVGTGCCG